MPKTAKTRPARNVKNLVILTSPEVKTLVEIIESIGETYHLLEFAAPEQRRYLAKLNRIKAKLRRGF